MDEPTSALDPLATARIEELVRELKKDYTVVIVTHNMQQAARISDDTAFFLMGEVIESEKPARSSPLPRTRKPKTILPVVSVRIERRKPPCSAKGGGYAARGKKEGRKMNGINVRRAFDQELKVLETDLLRLGTLAEDAVSRGVWALKEQDTELAREVIAGDDRLDDLTVKIESGALQIIARYQPVAPGSPHHLGDSLHGGGSGTHWGSRGDGGKICSPSCRGGVGKASH